MNSASESLKIGDRRKLAVSQASRNVGPLRAGFGATLGLAGIALLSLCWAFESSAQTYPAKPVRMVVPLAPGGSVDNLARVLAQKLTESMGQQVFVDNRGGASGNIGTELVTRAPADGYTIMTVSMTLVVNPFLFPRLPFDVVRDLAPVSLIGSVPLVLTVHPSVPVKSVRELVVLAKKHPGKLNYASSGRGTNSHLSMELFKTLTGTDIVAVQYRGGGIGQIALIAGEVDIGFNSIVAGVPLIKAGKIRPLAISSASRSSVLPELPTVAEAGVPGYTFSTWYGVLAPAGTPPAVVNLLNDHIAKAVRGPELAKRFAYEGAEGIASSPAQFATHIRDEMVRWEKVVRASASLRAN
jgi:tripartite-type tricarboxylate transporter receptor subunit TctC